MRVPGSLVAEQADRQTAEDAEWSVARRADDEKAGEPNGVTQVPRGTRLVQIKDVCPALPAYLLC